MYRTDDAGNTSISISPAQGSWTTPIAFNPYNSNSIYFGATTALYKSTDRGNNWNLVSSILPSGQINSMEISKADTNVIYVASYSSIYKSTNQGNSWQNITTNLPSSSAAITSITVDEKDAAHLIVSLSGYLNGKKIFESTNGGFSWFNISGTLPNIPFNKVVFYENGYHSLFAGSDLGIFYRDDSLSDWISFSNQLPNVIVDDIKIQPEFNLIRAATYGRGIWQSPINIPVHNNIDLAMHAIISPYVTGYNTVAPNVQIKNFGSTIITKTDIKFNFDNQPLQTFNWTGTLASLATQNILLPATTLDSGWHVLTCYVTNLNNGAVDANYSNDTIRTKFHIKKHIALDASIIDKKQNSITIYPSPNNGNFNIQFNSIN